VPVVVWILSIKMLASKKAVEWLRAAEDLCNLVMGYKLREELIKLGSFMQELCHRSIEDVKGVYNFGIAIEDYALVKVESKARSRVWRE